jgi:hypothetical protein
MDLKNALKFLYFVLLSPLLLRYAFFTNNFSRKAINRNILKIRTTRVSCKISSVRWTYFSNSFLAILHNSFVLMFVYLFEIQIHCYQIN